MNLAPRHLLMIEDNAGDVLLIREMLLEEGGNRFELQAATSLIAGRAKLTERRPTAVLLDLNLPDCTGIETLRKVRSAAEELPIIIISGLQDDEVAARAVREGAQDFLVKGRFGSGELLRTIHHSVERTRALRAARESEERYRVLFEANPFPMWVYHLESRRILAVSDSALDRYGYGREEFLGLTVDEIRPDGSPAGVGASSPGQGADPQPSSYERHVRKDGSSIGILAQEAEVPFDGQAARLVLLRDATDGTGAVPARGRAVASWPPARRDQPGDGETILVIDDEESMRVIVRDVLSDHGYGVILAQDGAEGMVRFLEHRQQIRVVITDLMMPFMDGISTIQSLTKVEPSVKVLLMSSASEVDLPQGDLQKINVRFLRKPFAAEQLLVVLREMLKPQGRAG